MILTMRDMIIIKSFHSLITILALTTILLSFSSSSCATNGSPDSPLPPPFPSRRYNVGTTTTAVSPATAPATSPSPSPAPAPAPGPATSPSPAPAPGLTTSSSSPPPPKAPAKSSPPKPPATSAPPKANPPSTSAPPVPASSSPPFRIPRVAPGNPALTRICTSTDYPDLCVSSISPFLTGAAIPGGPSPATFLGFSISAASSHAALSLTAFARIAASSPPSDEELAAALANCKDSYDDAVDNLKSAATALVAKDIGTVNSMISAVVTDSESCQDGFVGDSPVTQYNDKLRKLSSNCLAIATTVKF